ncbi:molybdenum cofactor biosynthesis protein MoaE [Niabella insulamsoli]|uniref:molybdenum cofactor biosynthesis protein MoaE n=1 Tax=Niabella insulamsoli TaxID=3144874 RepID=UPI0031FE3D0B
MKQIFIKGPVAPELVATSIAQHATKKEIGAHSIFLGQVRADLVGDRTVRAIEYTAYEDLALEKMHEIREAVFAKHELTCMHVYHSLGTVEAGAICLFVFTSSRHRRAAVKACEEVVEQIKAQLPVWGKEIFDDETHQWKQNH